ncbi:cupin domain-containing protein [Pseudomonas sp. BN515]|uniref:cupin domain-containing protein n=1 Tax=Pseudomonas sp. BN515 TaxID=2567892 RepID=UPI0024554826|nr:cupin domain-containing protein [Pseudomonas sp. BN515]MDH4869295.1 cupin domain-containing protein [Pseudomonas sp. BN515]
MKATLLKNTHDLPLSEPTPVAVPVGEPVPHTRVHSVERTDQVETGVWECSPGRFRRQIIEQEFCHFTHGSCTFTPDGGEPIEIKAGDALLLPANSLGVWDVKETLRKTYVIISR